ncbi:DUF5915 domain-containing protein [Ornithinibacillus sp. FSL M8-0202]
MYAEIDQFDPSRDVGGVQTTLDKWIVSRLNTVVKEVVQSLDAYDITRGARSITVFIDELSNWYVRRSRQRFWSSGMTDDKRAAFSTLYEVLTKLSQLMAPYTPFVSDDIYTNLVNDSVHVSDYPKPEESLIDIQLENDMNAVLEIIELTRSARNTTGIKTKQPLANLVVLPTENATLTDLHHYSPIIKEEVNVKGLEFRKDFHDLLQLQLKLHFAVAGPKLGKSLGEVKNILEKLDDHLKGRFVEEGELQLTLQSGELVNLTKEDILLEKTAKDGYALAEGTNFIILLEATVTKELKEEGLVREFIRVVQSYRKELNLPVDLRVDLYIQTDLWLQEVLVKFAPLVERNLIIKAVHFEHKPMMRSFQVEEYEVNLYIQS